jgi:hypothetical protein
MSSPSLPSSSPPPSFEIWKGIEKAHEGGWVLIESMSKEKDVLDALPYVWP